MTFLIVKRSQYTGHNVRSRNELKTFIDHRRYWTIAGLLEIFKDNEYISQDNDLSDTEMMYMIDKHKTRSRCSRTFVRGMKTEMIRKQVLEDYIQSTL